MQIEELIGGVNGNTNAQAIQLRLRANGHSVVSNGRLRAWDAAGANPLLLLDVTTNVTTNTAAGSNVLLASAAFNSLMGSVPGYSSDFTLASTIPASYLTGGKVTWESDAGVIEWSLAFGAYTGTTSPNTGLAANTTGATGNFGSPAPAPPTSALQGIRTILAATATSTGNSADYAVTANPTTVRNNAGTTFTVVPEPGSAALLAGGVMMGVAFLRRRR